MPPPPARSVFALNLRHLRGIAAIARTRHLGDAAKAVHLSQPALTQGLSKIEGQLGVSLFDRQPTGMVPTAAGLRLAARAAEAEDRLADMLRHRRGPRGFAFPERLLTMTQLRGILALADAGSYVGAGTATGLSQPALHRAVRDVERLAGLPLVERRGRGVTLTEAGRRVARGARLATRAIANGIDEIHSDAGEVRGSIAVGAMPLARARLLPAAIAALHHRHPHATFTIFEGSHRELIDLLREGRLDLTLGALRDPAPGADVVQRPLLVDRLAIVARADHPVVRERPVTRERLAAFPWIVGLPGSPLRTQWEKLFEGRALPPAPIECGSVMTIRGLLAAADYLTLLSPGQIAMEVERGALALIEQTGDQVSRTIGVTTRAGWRPSVVEAAFLDALTVSATGLPENQSPGRQTDWSGTAGAG